MVYILINRKSKENYFTGNAKEIQRIPFLLQKKWFIMLGTIKQSI